MVDTATEKACMPRLSLVYSGHSYRESMPGLSLVYSGHSYRESVPRLSLVLLTKHCEMMI